jgi:Na+/melibiose symporter-like transporter
MKASAASLWLLMVAIGNLLVVFLSPLVTLLGERDFYILCIGIIAFALLLYVGIRNTYIYKEDREDDIYVLEEEPKEVKNQ